MAFCHPPQPTATSSRVWSLGEAPPDPSSLFTCPAPCSLQPPPLCAGGRGGALGTPPFIPLPLPEWPGGGWDGDGGVTGGLFLLVASPRAILQAGPPLPDTNSCHGGGFGMGSRLGGGVRSAPPPSPRGCHCAKSLPGSSAPSSQGLWWLRGSALILGIRGVCPPPRLLCPPLPKFSLTVRVWPWRGGARGGSHAPGPVRGSGL